MIWGRIKKSTPKQEKEFKENLAKEKITGKDKFAIIISAFLVIVLPCLLVLLGISFLMLWIFGAL